MHQLQRGYLTKVISWRVQEDTSEFLNGLLTALEHISLCQAGGAGAFNARSRVC